MALSNTAVPKYYGMFRDAVLRGEVPICKEIEMEMHRIDDLIANPGIYYDDEAVEGWIKFSENEMTLTDWDAAYITYVENDVSFFLSKCDKRMLQYFTALEQRCKSLKSPLLGKDVKVSLEKELSKIVTDLADPQKSELLQKTHEALRLPQEKTEFYVTKDGNVYQTA